MKNLRLSFVWTHALGRLNRARISNNDALTSHVRSTCKYIPAQKVVNQSNEQGAQRFTKPQNYLTEFPRDCKHSFSFSSSSSSLCLCESDHIQMQQRTSSSTSRISGEHRAINVAEQPQTKRRRTEGDNLLGLPLYDLRNTTGKREISLLRSAERWLHAIPVIVLLCLFVLWWYSFPGTNFDKTNCLRSLCYIFLFPFCFVLVRSLFCSNYDC